MVLAVDIGNSNVVIGCFEGKEILFTERLSTNRNSTAMEYVVLIKTVLELNGFVRQEFEGGIISSVVPVVTNSMPNTGIALPFFSYGGTALAVNLAQMGVVLSISRQRYRITPVSQEDVV